MSNLRNLLPSLGSLVAFESAGRLSSFSAAARELGMSQAAVSYAIARLESSLGAALFLREHRRVRLSAVGLRFHADITIGLSHIQRSAQDLRAIASGSHVTLACSTAFAAFWMVPRMDRFRADLPDVDLRIQTSDRDLDLLTEGIPLAVRGGFSSDWPQYDSAVLASELIYPVCSPSHLERFGLPRDAKDLLAHPLIHLEEPFRPATTWNEWFAANGVGAAAVPRGLRINDYVLVVQAVIEGQGVALGWHHLIEALVSKGLLVGLGEYAFATGKDFHLIWLREVQLSKAAERVREWLTCQGNGKVRQRPRTAAGRPQS
jgi:DNA-binding transcriptional LysR family regulator